MPDSHLAAIIAGEAGMCPITAMLAIAWLYQRNPRMYGYAPPSATTLWLAAQYRALPDPFNGSQFVYSYHDLHLRVVQQQVARLQYMGSVDCGAGYGLTFWR